ncbi:protein of unknown function [Ralstonia solanacearum CMR15]|nr:protein of unknown function [Ralstonia solanacearum CMR15]
MTLKSRSGRFRGSIGGDLLEAAGF